MNGILNNPLVITKPEYKMFKDYVLRTGQVFLDLTHEEFLMTMSSTDIDDVMRHFFVNPTEFLFFICKNKEEKKDIATITCHLDVEKLSIKSGEVIAFFKKKDIDSNKIQTQRGYLKRILNMLSIGKITKDFDILQVFHQCIKNGIIPLFQNLKAKSLFGTDVFDMDPNQKIHNMDNNFISNLNKKFNDLEATIQQQIRPSEINQIEFFYDEEIEKICKECAKKMKKPSLDDIPEKLRKDDDFIENLSENLTKWKSQTRILLNSAKNHKVTSVINEINFWINFHKCILYIDEEFKKPEIKLTEEMLRYRRKISKINIADSLELKSNIEKSKKIADVMKSITFNQIIASNHIKEIHGEIQNIFIQIKKLVDLTYYETSRLRNFIEIMNKEFLEKIVSIVREMDLLRMSYPNLQEAIKNVKFFAKSKWELQLDLIKEPIRIKRTMDISKHSKFLKEIKILDEKFEKIKKIKKDHENLTQLYTKIFERDVIFNENLIKLNFPTAKDVEREFEIFHKIDILDLTKKGDKEIDNAINEYLARTTELDKKIVTKIHEFYKKAVSKAEKFKIFSKFSILQQRPYIKQELQTYQDNLIKIIEEDIFKIIEKYKNESDSSRDSLITKKYKISGSINSMIWSKQVLNNLNMNVEKMIFTLGENWTSTPKGKEINNIFNNFSKQVQNNIDEIIKFCEHKYKNKLDQKILSVRQKTDGSRHEFHVNVNEENRMIIKAMRFLFFLKKDLKKKHHLKFIFKKISWPSYLSGYTIQNAITSFNSVIKNLNPTYQKLLTPMLKSVYLKLVRAYKFTWFMKSDISGDSALEDFSLKFVADVNNLEKMLNYIIDKNMIIDNSINIIKKEDEQEKLFENIKKIQNIIFQFEKRGLKNMSSFIRMINDKIEKILLCKIKHAFELWNYEFLHLDFEDGHNLMKGNKYIIEMTSHEVLVQNHQISLHPPLESTRAHWMDQMQTLISKFCSLPKIRKKFDFNYDGNNKDSEKNVNSFKNIAFKLPIEYYINCYNSLNDKIDKAIKYFDEWKKYQALWEIDIKKVYEILGKNQNHWRSILDDIKKGKKIFDFSTVSVHFGPIKIHFRIAQRKISNKYDSLHSEILNEFGKNLLNSFQKFFSEIKLKREKIEDIDFHDSEKIIQAITDLKICKENMYRWNNLMNEFRNGEKLLYDQEFSFPANWKDFYHIESEWNRFEQTYNSKQGLYKKEFNNIKSILLKEEEALKKKVDEIKEVWNNKKPYSGNLHPKEAIEIIDNLESKITSNKNAFTKLNKAKELLELPLFDLTIINSIVEDSSNLKEMWTDIGKCWEKVDKIMDTHVKNSNPNKFHKTYENILQELNSLPNKYRTYEALVTKKKELNEIKNTNNVIKELRSEAIKEKHWNKIIKETGLKKKFKDLKIGDLYKNQIMKYQSRLEELIHDAQGELVLDNMLKEIREYWNYEEFQLGNYQDKCKLIKGWDDILTKIEDDLGQIDSTKGTKHFAAFKEEFNSWSEKLKRMQTILETWKEVQKRWVYLEGIFFGSSDIAQQLPNQYARFRSVDNDFTSLMKKTAQKLKILNVCLGINNLEKSLRLLYDNLEKIKKALAEYLENQRQLFARFYFVGDEDLLEVIGNSKEVTNIQKFFSKMFAGINFVENDDGLLLKGMRSRQNETVEFSKSFNLSDYKKINEWLTELEYQMQQSLADKFEMGIKDWATQKENNIEKLVKKYCAQDVLISFQTYWTFLIEDGNLEKVVDKLVGILDFMAEAVLTNLPKLLRSKYEQLITEFVHKRDTTRKIHKEGINPNESFSWFSQMKYYNKPDIPEVTQRLRVKLGNSDFPYGYEYLGITEKLVQTPLTDKCYFTLTQALWLRMGGAPFGPAGTGKTESVKMLGSTLGRFVLVFNCDETFNTNAMGRIFIGLCQVGAWGCFDEFNRLEESILSTVSEQILTIQMGLRENKVEIDLLGREVKLNNSMGIFITMNPGYAGRSNLPENLKQLFRQMAMIKPDRELIAQVMLFSQGFKSAEQLSGKVVSLFELCNDQLSSQPHYDFGLRALKSVLNSAGGLKRIAINKDADLANQPIEEQKIILRSFCDTVVPKLISEDTPLLESLIKGVFPDADIPLIEDLKLSECISIECKKRNILETDNFIEKILQLNQILKLQHGVMLVGQTGCGKTSAWQVLLSSLYAMDKQKGESYIIDPKAISKDELYGKLDDTTMEWTDGIFTHILRGINENSRGKRHWIVFDGDVDPEWVENLNSVLDDNKLLTLPNGERIAIPPCVKIMFEVESLKYATLATVSRCGMVWFSKDVLEPIDIFFNYTMRLKLDIFDTTINLEDTFHEIRKKCVNSLENIIFGKNLKQAVKKNKLKADPKNSLLNKALEIAKSKPHVMKFTEIRVLEGFFTLLRKGIENIVEYNKNNKENQLSEEIYTKYIKKWFLMSMNWAFVGDLKLSERSEYYQELLDKTASLMTQIDLPETNERLTLIDYGVDIETGEWVLWKNQLKNEDIDDNNVKQASVIIPTVDTMRHQTVLCSWLLEKRPFIICGPPGSGKTMTLMSTLKSLPDYEMIFVNFSSSTTPELILRHFEQHCEYEKKSNTVTLKPKQINKNLVLFCDEINLPDEDNYGTQYVITFLRQLTEKKGFWRLSDHSWVNLERVQFVGACNPPTDAGRHPMAARFMRHCPLMMVDFPGYDSLMQIYGTFNKAMLKSNPNLSNHWEKLTTAMVEYYSQSQKRFTSDMHAHYIYSPRELTRWKYAIVEALSNVETLEQLIRLWAHEALRLFEDRLVTDEEKEWCQESIDRISKEVFNNIDFNSTLKRPILFSTYLTKSYMSVEMPELKSFIIQKLKDFNEENYSVNLVVFDSMLEHIIRIDRVLRQPIGHMLLVGASGVGKTTLSRFVSWMNGLSIFQIKAGRDFTLEEFDQNLREVMKRAGCKMEKITFIFDESNVLGVAFLERMNALLASGEVPGLFEGEDFLFLVNEYKEHQGNKKRVESNEEIYAHFTKNVQRNLHVVFTMNPASPDFSNRAASSPAIFNRCVIDWFGDWSNDTLVQVARELIEEIEIPENSIDTEEDDPKDVMVKIIVKIHGSVILLNDQLKKGAKRFNYLTPRDFLDFIHHINELHKEKKEILKDQQSHLNSGLEQLKETELNVKKLDEELETFTINLNRNQKKANEKINIITSETEIGQKKKKDIEELLIKLKSKKKEINKRKIVVEKELALIEPTLKKAKKAVAGLDKKEIKNLKNYKHPPELIRFTLEAVCFLITGNALEWKSILGELNKKKFLDSIQKIKGTSKNVSKKIKDIKKNYLNHKNWNIENIKKSLPFAGFLATWLESLIFYAEKVKNIEPMNQEINKLSDTLHNLEVQNDKKTKELAITQKSIKNNTEEYSLLIAKIENIKNEQEKTNKKVVKSRNLLKNLSSEKNRWQESSDGFVDQLSKMTGNVILSSAFLAYCGFFDQLYRALLINTWKSYLDKFDTKFKSDLSISEFLSTASERMTWKAHRLPDDDLCTQNAIILKRHNRYPLIIDPSGQAIEFVLSFYKEKKIEKSDLNEKNFFKKLQKCLRFGFPIIIRNVEKMDPMMNSLLNKEVIRKDGRNMVVIGKEETDFNSNFVMFMLTRNSDAKFTPDLCSRVTFVNFTVTQASLQNQCINIYLKNERADVEQKRIDLLKLQGEYLLKLRNSEDKLLTMISEQKGKNILENDELIKTLDDLKNKAMEITKQMEDSGKVLEEIEKVTQEYQNISYISAKIYFTLQQFSQINKLYQYSFQFYMNILLGLLKDNEKLNSIDKEEFSKRIEVILEQLFIKVYHSLENSILDKHKLIISLKFCQLKIGKDYHKEFKAIIEPCKIIESSWSSILDNKLNKIQLISLENLSNKEKFKDLKSSLIQKKDEWIHFISNRDELEFPLDWLADQNETMIKITQILIFNILKPSHSMFLMKKFIEETLTKKFLNGKILDLEDLIKNKSTCKIPLFFSSAPGFDPSYKILQTARKMNKKYESIAVGSKEILLVAQKALIRAMNNGTWLILKNVHLASSWLKPHIEEEILKNKPSKDFRVFLVSEFSNKIPITLLRQSIKVIFELPDGIKSNVYRNLSSVIDINKMEAAPKERARIYFQIVWLHAVIMERLRYTPIGWSKSYEFSEADLKSTLEIVDQFLEKDGDPLKHIFALRSIISNNIYGGKIDNVFDLKILSSLVDEYMDMKFFRDPENHPFVTNGDKIIVPGFTAKNHEEYLERLKDLEDIEESPIWAGLPFSAEDVLKKQKLDKIIKSLLVIQDVNEEEIAVINEEEDSDDSKTKIKWLKELAERCKVYIKLLPKDIPLLKRTKALISNPLFRFLERETTVCAKLLINVRKTLNDLIDMIEGRLQPLEELKIKAKMIYGGGIPKEWKKFVSPEYVDVSVWIQDFKNRLDQILNNCKTPDWQRKGVNLGYMIFPEAFLTATRQFVAQKKECSLDNLELRISLTKENNVNEYSFLVKKMKIEGVEWNFDSLKTRSEISFDLPNVCFEWKDCNSNEIKVLKQGEIFIPIYLNDTRKNLLVPIKFEIQSDELSEQFLYQRGIALIAWNL